MVSFLRGMVFICLGILNTALHASAIFALSLILFIPLPWLQRPIRTLLNRMAESWVLGNKYVLFGVLPRIQMEVEINADLAYKHWYLVLPNHQSWVDIILLFNFFSLRIPFLKFFLKQELLYVPFLGMACWALEMPFMRRYSRSYLEKYPERKGQDLETTKRACEKFRQTQVAVVNFMEGTRLTPIKHSHQESPYRHLLKPKAGGVAFVLSALGPQMKSALDVTIAYPGGAPKLWDLACGNLREVKIHVQERPIPAKFCQGDYENDAQFRKEFQEWIGTIWEEKDHRLDRMLAPT